MADISRLIGEDGHVHLGTIGTTKVGDSSDDFDDLNGGGVTSGGGFWQVVAIKTTSSYFTWTSPVVGDYFWNVGTGVMETGDTAVQLPTSNLTPAKGFSIDLTKAKVDTTVLTDVQKTYRMGKSDASGSITLIETVGSETISDKFMDRQEITSAGVFTSMNRLTNTPLHFVGWLQDAYTSGETYIAVVGKIIIESKGIGIGLGSAQEYTSNFAIYAGDQLMKINVTVA